MRESVAMLKEQLRMQGKEVQKLNAEKSKHDAKIQHVLKISQDKIEDLKETVAQKEEETRNVHSSIKAGVYTEGTTEKDQQIINELQESLDQTEKEVIKLEGDLAQAAKNNPASPTSEKTVEVKDPKLLKALKKLKLKNEDLEKRIEQQGNTTTTDDKEKELLTLELKRLRNQPDSSKELKDKIKQQEKKTKKSIESLQKLIAEKTELINSFEKIIYDAQDEEDSSKLPSEIIKDLKTTIEENETDKEALDKSLNDLKNNFKKKLDEELKKLEEDLGGKLKTAAPEKKETVAECEEGAPAWMATFSDMVTLMLVFFILMYAIASKNVQTFKSAIIGAEAKSIGVLEALNAVEVQESLQSLKSEQSDDILSGMSEVIEDTDMSVETSASKVVVRVPGARLFKPGQADLQLEARPLLDAVIRVVNKHPNYKIHIQGHTDDEPISTDRFPTNWELSSARATAVLRYFIDKGAEPERMTATGYADTFPLGRNDTVPGRDKNRRVEFVLEKEN